MEPNLEESLKLLAEKILSLHVRSTNLFELKPSFVDLDVLLIGMGYHLVFLSPVKSTQVALYNFNFAQTPLVVFDKVECTFAEGQKEQIEILHAIASKALSKLEYNFRMLSANKR